MSPTNLQLPKVEKSEVLFNDFGELRRDTLRLPDGSSYPYYIMTTRPQGVLILAWTTDKHIIVNEEYRHPTGHVLLGFPGGFVDEGEEPLTAGQRELLEETGYVAEDYRVIGRIFPLPGLLSQETVIVCAQNAKQVAEPKREAAEVIHTVLLTLDALKDQLRAGCAVDGSLAAALCFLELTNEGNLL